LAKTRRSITLPGISSPDGYFRGEAVVERSLSEVGEPFAVLRPVVLLGGDGVLVNDIACCVFCASSRSSSATSF
jgi:hypothetical protein